MTEMGFALLKKMIGQLGFCSYVESFVQDFQTKIDSAIGKTSHNKIKKENAFSCHWRGKNPNTPYFRLFV